MSDSIASIADLLADPGANGVYRLARRPLANLPYIDARALAEADALAKAIGRVLDFPAYYGENWDALEECLFDLSWREGPVHLVIDHAEALDAPSRATLIAIWQEAAAYWQKEGRPACLLLIEVDATGLERLSATTS